MDDNDKLLESLALDQVGLGRQVLSLGSALHIIVAALMGFLVLLVYYHSSAREHRDKNLSLIIPVLSVLMAVIMRIEGSSYVLFFGIFGVLSVVRFRSDLTDQRGIAFILFALIEGILVGTSSWVLAGLAWGVVSLSILVGRQLLKGSPVWRLSVRTKAPPEEAVSLMTEWLRKAGLACKQQSLGSSLEYAAKTDAWEARTKFELLVIDQAGLLPGLLPALLRQCETWGFEAECRRGNGFLD